MRLVTAHNPVALQPSALLCSVPTNSPFRPKPACGARQQPNQKETHMKIHLPLLTAFCLGASSALATVTMSVTVDASVQDGAMPASFTGASFETGSLLYGNAGVSGYLFNGSRTDII